MKEDKNLISDGWKSLKHGLADLALGFFYVACATSRKIAGVVSKSAHSHPFAYMIVEAVILTTVYFALVGSARAERDSANYNACRLETSKDSLQIMVDSFIPTKK